MYYSGDLLLFELYPIGHRSLQEVSRDSLGILQENFYCIHSKIQENFLMISCSVVGEVMVKVFQGGCQQ